MKSKNANLHLATLILVMLTLSLIALGLASCFTTQGGIPCKHPNMEFVPYAPPKCDDWGNRDVYVCFDCKHYFLDAEGKIPTIDIAFMIEPIGGEHNYVDGTCTKCGHCQHLNATGCICEDCGGPSHHVEYVPEKPTTCEEEGYMAYYLCVDCGKAFGIYDKYCESAHDVSYFLSSIAYGHYYDYDGTCIKCDHFDETQIRCPHSSWTNCTCNLCGEVKHWGDLIYFGGEAPTCTQSGYKDYYQCYYCKSVYPENEPVNEITDIEDLIIPSLGGEHSYVGGVCTKCQHIKGTPDVAPSNPFVGHKYLCTHPNMRFNEYRAPQCDWHGAVEFYYCPDCLAFCLDAEGKNKVDYDETIKIPAVGHRELGGICELCGIIDPFGNSNVGNGGDDYDPSIPPKTPFEAANRHLDQIHDQPYYTTPKDYYLDARLYIEGEEFTVTWFIANENIKITYDESIGYYKVDVPDKIDERCYYSVIATVTDKNGQSQEHFYVKILVTD